MQDLDPDKVKMAQGLAKLFLAQAQAAGVPVDVRLMSIELVIRVLLDSDVMKDKRLQFFDRWTAAIRGQITGKPPKARKENGKAKTRHR